MALWKKKGNGWPPETDPPNDSPKYNWGGSTLATPRTITNYSVKPQTQNNIPIQQEAFGKFVNKPGEPIKLRDDFRGNISSKLLSGGGMGKTSMRYNDPKYGKLTDLYRYYGGQPLENQILSKSKYRPTNSKDMSATYIAIDDTNFLRQVIDNYDRVSKNGIVKGISTRGENKLNENTFNVSGYKSLAEGMALGHYIVSKGKDKKGEYISYYDKFDATPGKKINLWEKIGLTKPFEIYDRIYLKDTNKLKFRKP
jgi:hypothetical protein